MVEQVIACSVLGRIDVYYPHRNLISMRVQSGEEPGLYSGADWVSNIYERKNSKRNEDNRFLHFHVANFFKFIAYAAQKVQLDRR